MRSGIIAMALGGVSLALYSGCFGSDLDPGVSVGSTATPSPGTADEPGVVLRVEVGSGHSVTFYEPTPGNLVLAETMASTQKFVLSDKEISDALLAFAHLRPGEETPAALRAAYDRAHALPSAPVAATSRDFGGGQPEAVQAAASTPGVVQQVLTSSSSCANFVNNDGGCDWGSAQSFCRCNWSNGFWASWSPSTSGVCTVDHYAGNGVVIQTTVDGIITPFPLQSPGTIVQYSLGTDSQPRTRRIDITNASGDSFHAGCRWGR